MKYSQSHKKSFFHLPPEGVLEAHGPDDPLPYYYKPIIGKLYCKRIENAISLLSPPYDSLLELGYGSGILMPSLSLIANTVTGIDLEADPDKTRALLEKVDVHVSLRNGDVKNMNFQENSFDLVVAISIFEHININDLLAVVQKVFNILRPEGEFLVGMPRVDPLMVKAFKLIGYQNIEAHHITNYKSFLKATSKHFKLVKFSAIPGLVPEFACLYFNMLLKKKYNSNNR